MEYNIVDSYIYFALDTLQQFSQLIFVCCGLNSDIGKDKLQSKPSINRSSIAGYAIRLGMQEEGRKQLKVTQ